MHNPTVLLKRTEKNMLNEYDVLKNPPPPSYKISAQKLGEPENKLLNSVL
jgi:hypothetical protein